MLKKSKIGKKFTRNYFGGVKPDYVSLGISPEVRADPWSGCDTSRVAQDEITQKYKPIQDDTSLAGRLTTELYSRMIFADKLHNTDRYTKAVIQDMGSVEKLFDQSIFKSIFYNTNVPLQKRQAQLDEVLTDANVNFITRYFLAYILAEKRRANQIPSILMTWKKYMKERAGVREAKLITSQEITPEELESFRTRIKDALCSEHGTLKLIHVVDKSILGGFIIETGGSTVDNSWISSQQSWEKLQREKELKEASLIANMPKFIF